MKRQKAVKTRESQGVNLAENNAQLQENVLLLRERLAEIEFALEDSNWRRMTGEAQWEFSRSSLTSIIALARVMYLKNPMIRRAVEVQAYYVWGQGVNITSIDPDVQTVIDDFMEDDHNSVEMFSIAANMSKEREIMLDGNIFFVFFINPITGRVTLRTVPVEEISEIRTNPHDAKEPWYYKRQYHVDDQEVNVWYPAEGYNPLDKPMTIDGVEVLWDSPILHVGAGGLHTMKFQVPEVFSSLDWARAYKDFLEDWATIMRSYSRLAMKVSGSKGKDGVAASKAKLQTTLSTSNPIDRNALGTAGWFNATGGMDISAIKTAGATTSAEEGRPVKLMVASGVGLPDTFFGDANVGNFATAKTLDRPTELKFICRQKFWADVITRILLVVVKASIKATRGLLNGKGFTVTDEPDVFSKSMVPTWGMPEDISKKCSGRPKKLITVSFPSILERNVTDRVRAVVNAVTLFGKPLDPLFRSKRRVATWILQAMNVPDPERLAIEIYPDGEDDTIPELPDPLELAKAKAEGTAKGPGKKKPGGAEDPGQGGAIGDNG